MPINYLLILQQQRMAGPTIMSVNWFKKCFVPQAEAHADTTKPIVLIYDGHGSHVTLDMIDATIEHSHQSLQPSSMTSTDIPSLLQTTASGC
jgi:hypothetical protein